MIVLANLSYLVAITRYFLILRNAISKNDGSEHKLGNKMRKIGIILISLLANFASAHEYRDAKITGIGINPNDNFIRFTIDKAPNAIFFTSQYRTDQQKGVSSLILMAYASSSNIAFIRSLVRPDVDQSVRHYVELEILEVGSITHD